MIQYMFFYFILISSLGFNPLQLLQLNVLFKISKVKKIFISTHFKKCFLKIITTKETLKNTFNYKVYIPQFLMIKLLSIILFSYNITQINLKKQQNSQFLTYN